MRDKKEKITEYEKRVLARLKILKDKGDRGDEYYELRYFLFRRNERKRKENRIGEELL